MRFSVLTRLVAPLDAERFLEDHFGKRPAVLSGRGARFEGLGDIERLSSHATEIDAARVDPGGTQRQLRIDAAQVAPLHACGFTICASIAGDPVVSAVLTELAFELGLPGAPFAKLYSSPDDGGFALHFDHFHVFVVQLSGAKRWRFASAPVVEAPLAGGKLDAAGQPVWSLPSGDAPVTTDDGALVSAPDVSAFEEIDLLPGDCLYLPPGVWHVARARGHSVALSLSPPRTSVFALVSKALEDHLTRSALWRRDAFTAAPFEGTGKIPRPLAEQFDRAFVNLRAVIDSLDVRTLHRIWCLNVPSPEAPPVSPPPDRPIGLDDVFVHCGPGLGRYLVASQPAGPEEIYFRRGGEELSLPIAASRFVARLAHSDRFSMREACSWDPSLSRDEVDEILEQLLEAAFVRRLP